MLIAVAAVAATVLGLGMVAASALALRQRRVVRQPEFPPFPLDPAARRLHDADTHPDDPDTIELPIASKHE